MRKKSRIQKTPTLLTNAVSRTASQNLVFHLHLQFHIHLNLNLHDLLPRWPCQQSAFWLILPLRADETHTQADMATTRPTRPREAVLVKSNENILWSKKLWKRTKLKLWQTSKTQNFTKLKILKYDKTKKKVTIIYTQNL